MFNLTSKKDCVPEWCPNVRSFVTENPGRSKQQEPVPNLQKDAQVVAQVNQMEHRELKESQLRSGQLLAVQMRPNDRA